MTCLGLRFDLYFPWPASCLLVPSLFRIDPKILLLTYRAPDAASTRRRALKLAGGRVWNSTNNQSHESPAPDTTSTRFDWLELVLAYDSIGWLALPSKLQKLNIAQLLKRATRAKRRTTMQFGKVWRHPIQSEWAEALKLQRTPPCGRAVSVHFKWPQSLFVLI